jgi:Predicted membrane protein
VPPVFTFASGRAVFRTVRNGRDNGYNGNGNGYNGNGYNGNGYNGNGYNGNGFGRRRLRLRYRLVLENIRRVTEAHIHLGRPGQNGPIVAYLFGPNRRGISFGRGVITGVLSNRDLVGPLRGGTIRQLIREIERGNAYVNVHTRRNPDGEIRGQIRRVF